MDYYHVINRGVEKRQVFMDDGDHLRFIHDMYVFNDTKSAPNYIVKARQHEKRRNMLVRIHAFCLMGNHYHLLLSAVVENGISSFMQKLNMGYSKYFNEKYARSGVLWQGTFRKHLISRDAHFIYVPYYIHLNPLDREFPEWREGRVRKPDAAITSLETYRWSSHRDYLGIKTFPSVIYFRDLKDQLGQPARYKKEIRNIITSRSIATRSLDIEIP